MSIKRKKFIVLTLGDTESWGFNEKTLPLPARKFLLTGTGLQDCPSWSR
jgi:hypothetical protein